MFAPRLGQARCFLVESQAKGIEQRALAGTGGAGDGKQTGAAQGLSLKIDGELARQLGQILASDGQDPNAGTPVWAGTFSNSVKAARISAGGAVPNRF